MPNQNIVGSWYYNNLQQHAEYPGRRPNCFLEGRQPINMELPIRFTKMSKVEKLEAMQCFEIRDKYEDFSLELKIQLSTPARVTSSCIVREAQRALKVACDWNDLGVVRLLIEDGILRHPKAFHATFVERYAWPYTSYEGIWKYVIDVGANVNARDEEAATPLLLAAYKSHVPIARLLLNNGADPTCQDKNHESALSIAAAQLDLRIMQLLFAREDSVCELDKSADRSLLRVLNQVITLPKTYEDMEKCTRLLLKHGARPRSQGLLALPLKIATRKRDMRMVGLLLEAGAEPIPLGSDDPPVTEAMLNSPERILPVFLRHGIDPKYQNKRFWALLSSVLPRSLLSVSLTRDVLKVIVGAGANFNSSCGIQHSVLAHAIELGLPDSLIVFLINIGAEASGYLVDTQSGSKHPILEFALLKQRYSIPTLQILVAHGADFDSKDDFSRQSATLALCRQSFHYDLLAMVLSRGADVDSREDVEGRTCLMTAARCTNLRAVILLLQHGAAVLATDNAGLTAYDHAKKLSDQTSLHQMKEIEQILKRKQRQAKSEQLLKGIKAAFSVPRSRRKNTDTASMFSETTLVAEDNMDPTFETLEKLDEEVEVELHKPFKSTGNSRNQTIGSERTTVSDSDTASIKTLVAEEG